MPMEIVQQPENISRTAKIIIQVIESHGLSINDLRSCMQLSKEIRDSIFESSNIMARIKVNTWSGIGNKEIFFQFLSLKGKFIQNLDLHSSFTVTELKERVLSNVPNLRSLNCGFYFIPDCSRSTEQPIELQSLRHLTFQNREFEYFEINAKNLETLKFGTYESEDEEVIFNLLCQQESLKELEFYYSKTFPSRDISHLIKFKLTKFLYFSNQEDINENFMKFLDTQAENLKELQILGNYEPRIYEKCLGKFKNLEKLDINGRICSDDSQTSIFENIKTLILCDFDESELNFICKLFPKLEQLELNGIDDSTLMNLMNNFKLFGNLQVFKASCNCSSAVEYKINFLEKTIDVKAKALNDWKESSDILRENFDHLNFESSVFEVFDEIV